MDAGPGNTRYDPAIVRELRETETPATIFASGLWAEAYPDVLRSLARDPLFEIGNHSFSHAAFQGPCFGLPIAGRDGQAGGGDNGRVDDPLDRRRAHALLPLPR